MSRLFFLLLPDSPNFQCAQQWVQIGFTSVKVVTYWELLKGSHVWFLTFERYVFTIYVWTSLDFFLRNVHKSLGMFSSSRASTEVVCRSTYGVYPRASSLSGLDGAGCSREELCQWWPNVLFWQILSFFCFFASFFSPLFLWFLFFCLFFCFSLFFVFISYSFFFILFVSFSFLLFLIVSAVATVFMTLVAGGGWYGQEKCGHSAERAEQIIDKCGKCKNEIFYHYRYCCSLQILIHYVMYMYCACIVYHNIPYMFI